MSGERATRIVDIQLDGASIVRWNREVEHERQVAVFDLMERNSFRLVNGFAGPYRVVLSLREANLIFTVSDEEGRETAEIALSMRSFRRIIKDYFLICDSYFLANQARLAEPYRGDRHGAPRPARRGRGEAQRGTRRQGRDRR